MPVSAVTLQKLMNAGLSGAALVDVVASIDADMEGVQQAKPKTPGAIRQERYRHRKASQSVTSDVTRDVSHPLSPLDKEHPPCTP